MKIDIQDKNIIDKLPKVSDYELFVELSAIYEYEAKLDRDTANNLAVLDVKYNVKR